MRQSDRQRIAEQFRSDAALNECTRSNQTLAKLNSQTCATSEAIRRLQLIVHPDLTLATENEVLETILRDANLTYALEQFAIARIRSSRAHN